MHYQLSCFHFFWDAVAILEDRCGSKVMAITSDGASTNRSLYKMLCKMNNVEHINTDVAEEEEDRYIYLLGDAPHSQKKQHEIVYITLGLMITAQDYKCVKMGIFYYGIT